MSETISVHNMFSLGLSLNFHVLNNQSSYCGLVNAKIRASDKDLPVCPTHYYMHTEFSNLPMTLQHSHSLPARLNWMASLRGRTQPRKRQNVGRLLCSLPPTGSLGRHRPDQPYFTVGRLCPPQYSSTPNEFLDLTTAET